MSEENFIGFNITESSDDIADKLVKGLILPLLAHKEKTSGENTAAQLYLNLIYLLGQARAETFGHGAVHEIHGIASEIEENCFDVDGNFKKSIPVDESVFIETDGKPS